MLAKRMKNILKGCMAVGLFFVLGTCFLGMLLAPRDSQPPSQPKAHERGRIQSDSREPRPASPELSRVEARVAKLGLPESTRKKIYWKMGIAEYRAIFDTDDKLGKVQTKEWMDRYDRLVEIYEGEVAENYELTREQAGFIGDEGLMKQWPLPKKADYERAKEFDKQQWDNAANARERSAKAKTKRRENELKAETKLRLAENLEKMGKAEAAISYYREIVKDLGETPAARTAKERLRTLTAGRP